MDIKQLLSSLKENIGEGVEEAQSTLSKLYTLGKGYGETGISKLEDLIKSIGQSEMVQTAKAGLGSLVEPLEEEISPYIQAAKSELKEQLWGTPTRRFRTKAFTASMGILGAALLLSKIQEGQKKKKKEEE